MAAGKARPRHRLTVCMTEQIGSDGWLARVFAEKVRRELFADHAPQEAPVLVLLGGQPAAGKTRAQHAILAEHAADDLVEITGDDLREYHPDYDRLADEAPFEMPAATAPVSGGLVRLALDHAREHRYSVLLEGTFRDADMVTGNALRFADAGYRVEVVAVATPAAVSRLSAEMRSLSTGYPDVGRWTPPEAHESAVVGSAGVLSALEALPQVGRVRVFSREKLLFDNQRNAVGEWEREPVAAQTLRHEQDRPLSPSAATQWLKDYSSVFRRAKDRPGYLGPNTAPAYARLQEDAAQMLRILSDRAKAAEFLLHEHHRRQLDLEHRLPSGTFPPRPPRNLGQPSAGEHRDIDRQGPSLGR